MKKLTAGIFASILGLTAMGAADAAVTSKAYVDAAVDAVNTEVAKKVDTTTYDAGQKTQNDRIQDLETASATHATKDELTAETNARVAADELLQKAIDDIEDVQGDYATKTELQTETDARTQADTALDGKITAETNARTAADTELDGKITAETNARTAADTELDGKITAEATTRAEADDALRDAIEAIEGGVGEIESAGIGNDGQYALTMVKNGDTITYKWERIDRAYDANDLGEDTGDKIYANEAHKPANQ